MVTVHLLGMPGPRTRELHEALVKAATFCGVELRLLRVERQDELDAWVGVRTPALVIDDQLCASGEVPDLARLTTWLTTAELRHGES